MNMNRVDDAIKHFILSLKHLGNSHPKSMPGTMLRTFSAYMTQVLHRRMPDTFKERSECVPHYTPSMPKTYTSVEAHLF